MISEILANKQACIAASKPTRLPILGRNGDQLGALRLLNKELASDKEVLGELTEWRRTSMRFFLTHFEPSTDRTHSWLLKQVFPASDTLFFLLETDPDAFVGNFGVTHISESAAELDNLIRGKRGGGPEFIYFAECSLLWWLFADASRSTVTLNVFSDNAITLALHASVGFLRTRQQPLWFHTGGPDHGYVLADSGVPADFTYDELSITRGRFFEHNPWVLTAFASGYPSTVLASTANVAHG